MSLPKFLYFITEKDGRTRQIINKVVTSLNNPVPLPQAPDGNQEISIGWERSQVYRGNIRNFGLELGFVGDGGTILRNDRYKFTIDRELYLLIKRLTYEWNDLTFKEYYKQLYKGQFDFSTANDDQGGYRFNIGLMEGGLQRLLKANESTTYEIPFDLDSKNVLMDGMLISEIYKFFVPTQDRITGADNDNVAVQAVPITNEGHTLAVFENFLSEEILPTAAESPLYIITSTQDIPVIRMQGLFAFSDSTGFSEMLWITSTNRLIPIFDSGDLVNGSTTIDMTFNALKGENFFLVIRYAGPGSTILAESNFNLTFDFAPPASFIKGFTLLDAGRKIVEKITGNADDFDSTLLADLITEFGSEIILTSGDGVRGITNAVLKTSWRDYYKFVDVMLMTQMTITDKIRIFDRITAYQPISVKPALQLGEIKNLKVTPAIDEMFTSIKCGHADPQVDDTNGKFAFNSNMVFTTPVKSIPEKQLDLQTNYKADPYEIEQTRANYEGKTTTDKETDNDVFALAVQKAEDDIFTSTSVFDPTGGLFFTDNLISIVAPTPVLRPGMKIRITNATNPDNNKDYTLKNATTWFFGQLIQTNETMTAESGAVITIEILEGQLYNLDRTIPITQLADPDVEQAIKDTVYNVRLSPKRILLRHSAWIAGAMYGYSGDLVFSSANRNKELIAGGIIEKANVSIVSLGDPMFIPQYFEFDLTSPIDMPEDLENDPNPNYNFPWKNSSYNGFFIRGGIALNDLEEQAFKLLSTPDNDLTSLIY